jgi:hypothetical protein
VVLAGEEVLEMTAKAKQGPTEKPAGDVRREQARVAAEKMLAQLQEMIETAGKTAGPVLRDVAAKAAELTAVAAENAGPAAHKAAELTDKAGAKLATRSRELAADLHQAAEASRAAQAEAEKQGKG